MITAAHILIACVGNHDATSLVLVRIRCSPANRLLDPLLSRKSIMCFLAEHADSLAGSVRLTSEVFGLHWAI